MGIDVVERLGLSDLPDPERQRIASAVRQIELPAKTTIFSPGAPCEGWVIVERGSVKVTMTSESGRDILLYRVRDGESCVMTTSSLFSNEPYAVSGTTEVATTALMMPSRYAHEAIAQSETFRQFIFRGFGQRMIELLHTMEGAVFQRLDSRIASLLLERAGQQSDIAITQSEIASELGSAREVICRLLARMSDDGLLQTRRGAIQILDRPALQKRRAGAL
ncbi:MAG: Crp/Fnr family transcriptional regulator [Rhodobacteraceae bacterium]|nr:Crp/Fnr family transcriptional regulator [Paracoccaceae bacterium]